MVFCSVANGGRILPGDERLAEVLRTVRLGQLLDVPGGPSQGLNRTADWGGVLSLGEQQRLAFARSDHWKPTFG